MKTLNQSLTLLLACIVAASSPATGQQADSTKDNQQPTASKPNPGGQTPAADKPETLAGGKTADAQAAAAPAQEPPAPQEPAPAVAGADDGKGLRLNFRAVPLDLVLNYLSDAAGFIINIKPGTDVKGKTVDVWSNQPLNKDEAVDLLNTVLNQNGFAAVRKGRTLTIMGRDEAKKDIIPVISSIPTNGPAGMADSDEMVTQIVPIRYANATQMTKDLQPLLPSYANLTANESANALVLTDTQADARRMVQIVRALDTSISSIATVRVFPLKFADAKILASAVKDLFQAPTQQNNNNNFPGNRFLARFGAGGPFGGPAGAGGPGVGDQAGTGNSEARTAASRVVAVADEGSNSLVVSAPEEFIETIEHLVAELDVSVADITELRVFHLRNADPVETVDMFSQLFPDETKTSNVANQNQPGFRFGGGFAGGFNNNNNANRGNQDTTSERAKKKGRVLAVADQRTSSIIVSAARDLMPEIEAMVEQLDSNPARKQKVYFFPLENADPQQAVQILQDMFQRNNTQVNRNNANQNSALSSRAQSNNQNQNSTTATGFGNTGLGNSGGLNGGQGQLFR